MNPRIQKVLGWVGYPVFYLFALVLFSYLTAPYDRLRHALVAGFNSEDTPLRLELDELSWSWRFPGVSGSGGRFVGEVPPPGPDGKKVPRPEYTVDDFHARVALLPLLVGTTAVSFGLEAFGGELSGAVSDGSDERTFEIEIGDVSAAELPYLADLVGLPVEGVVAANLDLTLPEGQLGKAEGEIQLDIEDLALGDGKAKIRGTIALPRVHAGLFSLSATVEEGRLTIEQFSAKGTDLEVIADGKIRLLDKPETSLVEMDLRFKFSDKYKSKNDMTKALFGAPDSKVPGVFDLDPQIKRAKRDDGFYAWRLTGPINKLNFQPAAAESAEEKRSARGAATARKKPARKPKPKKKRRPRLPNFAEAAARKASAPPPPAPLPSPVAAPPPPPSPVAAPAAPPADEVEETDEEGASEEEEGAEGEEGAEEDEEEESEEAEEPVAE